MPAKALARVKLNRVGTAALFVGILVLLFPARARSQQAQVPKRILVLYWYNKDFRGNVVFDQSFQAVLQSAKAGTVEYYPEYLESNRFPGENYSLLLRDYLRQKYADLTIDAVVAVGDPPLEFLLKYRDNLFAHTPIVFVAAKSPTAKELAAGPGITGFIILDTHRETVDLALKLHPGTEHLFIVSGSPDHDKKHETVARKELQGYESKLSITYLTDLPPNELVNKIASLPERSIVLYVWQQAYDDQGKLLESADILPLIARTTSAPIYGMSGWQVGQGIVGGYVLTLEAKGNRAAEIALRIASGARPLDIPVEIAPTVPMFDWRQLRRWRISEESLPPGSIVQFRVNSLWEDYKWPAIALISVIIIQSGLIAGLIINRTLRKRAEEERGRAQVEEAETRTRLAGLIGSARDAIISIDQSERVVLFNAAAQEMFGCAERDAMGQPLDRFIPERFREAHHQHVRAFGETNATKGSMGSITGRRADGEEFPIEASISQLELHGQKFYTLILRDMTEQHQAVEALRESEERFRNMADTAPVMIWVSGLDKGCIYVNQQWLAFTGRTIEEELGDGWAENVHSEDGERCYEIYTTAFDLRQPFTMEFRVRRADGRFRWVLDSGAPRFSPAGEFLGYIGLCLDITERKAAKEALQNLSGQLIRAREDECARIARELHDDVNQRMALVAVDLEQLGQNPPNTPDQLRTELKGVRRQILETSKEIHQISHDLHPSKLEYLGLVAGLESLCEELHKRHGLKIEFIHEEVPDHLERDISLCLYRIVQECLSNVIRHSGAQAAKVELAGRGTEIRLRVSDSGIGFDIESQRLRKGLGLVSMRERLRLVGGSLSIDSRPSKGTHIDARVPLRRMGLEYDGRSPDDKTRTARR